MGPTARPDAELGAGNLHLAPFARGSCAADPLDGGISARRRCRAAPRATGTVCAWRWSEYDPTLRTRYETRYGKAAIPTDMPLQDWGTTYGELEPYHDLFEQLFGLAGKAGNIKGVLQPGGNPFEAPRRGEYPQKPLEMSEAQIIFQQAAQNLGYRPFPQPAANSPQDYVNPDGQRLGQCQYCGHCERFVCEAHAKASPDILLYPMLRSRSGFEIRTQAHVLHIDYDRRAKRATGGEIPRPEFRRGVRAAGGHRGDGGIHDEQHQAAAAKWNRRALQPNYRKGSLGKNFCYQTCSGVDVFFKDRWINPFLAAGASGTVIDEFNNDNFDHSGLPFLGGASISASVCNGRPIRSRSTPPGTPRWGTAWKKATADWYAHSFSVGAQGTCYPHLENFLDLDPDYTDAFGRPLLRMTFDFRENELRMSDWVTRKTGEICKAMSPDIMGEVAGYEGAFDTRDYQTTHVTGGTIMGAEPRSSVVSPHLQHWDAQNVFVVGASVYPHNSGYNPHRSTRGTRAASWRRPRSLCRTAEIFVRREGAAPVLRRCLRAVAIMSAAVLGVATAGTQNTPAASTAFGQCAVCHSIDGSNGTGPTLLHLIGRKSGAVPGFRYSRAMRTAEIIWNDATLDRYLSDPQELVPGNTMPFAGVAVAQERADIIAYLRTLQ